MTQLNGDIDAICESFEKLGVADSKHVRFDEVKGLYTNDKFCWEWILDKLPCCKEYGDALRSAAGPRIYEEINKKYGEAVANDIFKNTLECKNESHEIAIDGKGMRKIGQALKATREEREKAGEMAKVAKGLVQSGDANAFAEFITKKLPLSFDSFQFVDHLVDAVQRSLSEDTRNYFKRLMALCYFHMMIDVGPEQHERELSQYFSNEGNPDFCRSRTICKSLMELLELTGKEHSFDFDASEFFFHPSKVQNGSSLDEDTQRWMLDQMYVKLYEKEDQDAGRRNSPIGYEANCRQHISNERNMKPFTSDRRLRHLHNYVFPEDQVKQIAEEFSKQLQEMSQAKL